MTLDEGLGLKVVGGRVCFQAGFQREAAAKLPPVGLRVFRASVSNTGSKRSRPYHFDYSLGQVVGCPTSPKDRYPGCATCRKHVSDSSNPVDGVANPS